MVDIYRNQIMSAEQDHLIALKDQLSTVQREYAQAQQAYKDKLLRELGITRKAPLIDRAEEIMTYATREGADPKWFFRTLDTTAFFLIKYPPRFTPVPEEAVTEFMDVLPINDTSFLQSTRMMYTGDYDDYPGYPQAEHMLAQAEVVSQVYEKVYKTPQEMRFSLVYRWIRENILLFCHFGALGAAGRREYLES